MKNRVLKAIVFVCCAAILWVSCTPEDEIVETSASARLSFLPGSLLFDTVFTEQLSVTKRLKIYNPNDKALEISEIRLAGMATSSYSLIINGLETNSATKTLLRGKDSMYVLVSVYLDRKSQVLPFLVSDSILFTTNGNVQKVQLQAWGQNAHYYKGDTLSTNTTWDSTDARFIYNSVYVPQNVTLTIEKGTKIYARNSQGLLVAGTLVVSGTAENKVVFAGPRLENYFDNIPGQWLGIRLLPGSGGHQINWAEIKNAETGLLLGDTLAATTPDLKLTNTSIKNMYGSGVLAYHSDVTAWNNLVANCSDYGLLLLGGGNYTLYNNTVANYSYTFSRNGVSVKLSGKATDNATANNISADMVNNIFWGDDDENGELILDNKTGTEWQSLVLKRNIARYAQTGDTANLWNQKPRFLDSLNANFGLDSLSPAIGKGLTLPQFSNDLNGNSRSPLFDIGAYQYKK